MISYFIEHYMVLVVLAIVGIVVRFIYKSMPLGRLSMYIPGYKVCKQLIDKVARIIRINNVKRVANEHDKVIQDIRINLNTLKTAKDDDIRYTAIIYLLTYPSVEGFVAIMEYAVKCNQDVRSELICLMCDSSRTSKWY
jgi:hypothetical protein